MCTLERCKMGHDAIFGHFVILPDFPRGPVLDANPFMCVCVCVTVRSVGIVYGCNLEFFEQFYANSIYVVYEL